MWEKCYLCNEFHQDPNIIVMMCDLIDNIYRFFKSNKYSLSFLACIFLSFFISIFYFYIEITHEFNPFSDIPNHIIKCAFDALMLTAPFFVIKRKVWAFVPLILLDIFCLTSVWYYRNYLDIIPFSSFLLVENLSPVLVSSTLASTEWVDLAGAIPTLVTMVAYKLWFQNGMHNEQRRLWLPAAASTALFLGFYLTLSVSEFKNRIYDSMTDRFTIYANNIMYFDTNGLCIYMAYNIISGIIPEKELTQDERSAIDGFINEKPRNVNGLYAHNEGKNLVLIIVESLNSWVIGKEYCGEEITPCLNRIVNDSNSIAAVHVLSQVKDGRSSDGQFMFNTGLLPVQSGAVATRYDYWDYPSLPKALKKRGYVAVNMTVDYNNFWNQEEISRTYAYDFNIDKLNGKEMTPDSMLMERAIERIKQEKGRFMYQLITGSSHKPYNKPAIASRLSQAAEFPEEIRNYMEIIHYTDRCIGNFIDALKANGMYDNTIIAIASDHNQLLTPFEMNGYNDTECAFIVANAGIKHTQEAMMGQIDVYPTLLDLMNCNDYQWQGLGRSILRDPVSSAVGWDGKVHGNEDSPMVAYQKKAWKVNEQIIEKGYLPRLDSAAKN